MTVTRPPSVMRQRGGRKRRPNALIASALPMTGALPAGFATKRDTPEGWQQEAWSYYDTVGELRFGSHWLANAMSRVNLIAAVPPDTQGDEPTAINPVEQTALATHVELVASIAGGVAGQGALLSAASLLLTIPGIGYITASPTEDGQEFSSWRVLSLDEVKRQGDRIQIANGKTGDMEDIDPEALLIRVWRSHPRKAWEPDSPVRAVLTTLAEITLLTKRIAADARSRLTGAGLLVLPSEVEFPGNQGVVITTGTTPPPEPGDPPIEVVEDHGASVDDFVETMVRTFSVPITDQDSPAAIVPLVITIPGEYCDKVQHITFTTSFDERLIGLRESAVKRLALGLDMPPEVLLGLGDTNHWSAWQIQEEAITLQIEPLAETVCHALTVGYLQPALEAAGLDKDSAIVWYDTSDLTVRPDRSGAAESAYDRIEISSAAYLRESGLSPEDMPTPVEKRERVLLDFARKSADPNVIAVLLTELGYLGPSALPAIDATVSEPAPPPEPAPEARALPEREEAPPDTAALVAACDGLVHRALERAGNRLRSAAARTKTPGSSRVECDDPARLHTKLNATSLESLDTLLDGGTWDRLPLIAQRHHQDPAALQGTLDSYVRALLATGHDHDLDRLRSALGV